MGGMLMMMTTTMTTTMMLLWPLKAGFLLAHPAISRLTLSSLLRPQSGLIFVPVAGVKIGESLGQ